MPRSHESSYLKKMEFKQVTTTGYIDATFELLVADLESAVEKAKSNPSSRENSNR